MPLGVEEEVITEEDQELEEPGMYNVILINDDYTTFDFVVYVLVSVFKRSAEDAWDITNKIHHEGRGIAGTYIKDIAETKSALAEELATQNDFPLETKVEKV